MNLTSCSNCGVVLDLNKLDFDHEIKELDEHSEEYCEWTQKHYVWGDDGYVAFVPCPVCKNEIREDGE